MTVTCGSSVWFLLRSCSVSGRLLSRNWNYAHTIWLILFSDSIQTKNLHTVHCLNQSARTSSALVHFTSVRQEWKRCNKTNHTSISDASVMYCQSFMSCVYKEFTWRVSVKEIRWCWKSNEISHSPQVWSVYTVRRCRSRPAACAASTHAGIQSNLHLPSWAVLRGFILLCLLFLFQALFSAVSSTYYF